jgi:hypothetical protein
MSPKRKATKPNPEALQELLARLIWFRVQRELERRRQMNQPASAVADADAIKI